MVLTKAVGNAKLVLWDVREFGHWHFFFKERSPRSVFLKARVNGA